MRRFIEGMSMQNRTLYNENYSPCDYTHAGFRVISDNLDLDDVAKVLGIAPTRTHSPREPSEGYGWFLSTEGILDSLDLRDHLDWILMHVSGKREAIKRLQERGYQVDIGVKWDSKYGHDGPTLSPENLIGLGKLGLEVWFDIYFFGGND